MSRFIEVVVRAKTIWILKIGGILSFLALFVMVGRAESLEKLLCGNVARLELLSALASRETFQSDFQHDWYQIVDALEYAAAENARQNYYLGMAYLEIGKKEQALRVWKSSEGATDFLIGLGDYYGIEDRPFEMRRLYDLALAVNPDSGRALYRWGKYHQQSGEWGKALNFFQAAAPTDDLQGNSRELVDCYYRLGETLGWHSEWQEATDYFRKAVDLKPDDSRYRLSLARAIYLSGQDASAALQQVDCAIKSNPKDTWAYLISTDIYMREGNYAQALITASEAVRISPVSAWPYIYRGRVYLDGASNDLAWRDLVLAVTIDPSNADAHCYLGITYLRLERTEEAAAELLLGIQIDPTKRWCYLELGEAYEQLGRWEQAIDVYEELLMLDPQNKEARERALDLREDGQ